MRLRAVCLFFILIGPLVFYGQGFTPIAVSGFSHDVIAEGPPSPLATTTIELDAIGSNKVMYSLAFANFAGISGGLPDNGTIINGADSYQLGNYTSSNALLVKRDQSFDLTINAPASFAKVRFLCFSTEGPSTVNINLGFTDGTTTNYITGAVLADWFFGTTNIVTQGFGRCNRIGTGPFLPDGLPTNPRFYYIEITLNCNDIPKLLQKATISNVSTSGNAPFPNAVFLGISGLPFSQQSAPVITACNCSGPNGSIALNITGSSAPFTYSWNTTPVQTGSVATGLPPGPYTCTVTNASGCTSTYTMTVPLNNNAVIAASASPATVCPGTASQLTASATTGIMNTYTWTPGNMTGPSVSVTPGTTTTYTVNAGNALGCTASTQVTVTVSALPLAPIVNPITVCPGGIANLQVVNPQPGIVYNWYDAASGGIFLHTGPTYTTPPIASTFTFHVEAVSGGTCISSRIPVTVTVSPPPSAPMAAGVAVCTGNNAILSVTNPLPGTTYNWYSSSTGGTVLGTGATHTVNNVSTAGVFYVEAVNGGGCSSSTRTAVTISILRPLPQPVLSVTNVSFSSITFSWNAIPGATGYEVTTNGGATFQVPSSGSLGTTHTISGLAGNTTVILQVRAIGGQVCENSILSAPVPGTTLSSKEIFVPNVFTPNGDGKNDVLLVYGNYIGSMQLRIFNQWGQMIFLSTNPSIGWNGMHKGEQQPVGVYAYTLNVVLLDGRVVNKKGSINLIR